MRVSVCHERERERNVNVNKHTYIHTQREHERKWIWKGDLFCFFFSFMSSSRKTVSTLDEAEGRPGSQGVYFHHDSD